MTGPSTDSWEHTSDQPPSGFISFHHHSLALTIQAIFYPGKIHPAKMSAARFCRKMFWEMASKALLSSRNPHPQPFPYPQGGSHCHRSRWGWSQARSAFSKSMLIGPDSLIVLYGTCNGTQDDQLHDLPWHQGQTYRPVFHWKSASGPTCPRGSHLSAPSHLAIQDCWWSDRMWLRKHSCQLPQYHRWSRNSKFSALQQTSNFSLPQNVTSRVLSTTEMSKVFPATLQQPSTVKHSQYSLSDRLL